MTRMLMVSVGWAVVIVLGIIFVMLPVGWKFLPIAVVFAWAQLPPDLRHAVLAIVRSARTDEQAKQWLKEESGASSSSSNRSIIRDARAPRARHTRMNIMTSSRMSRSSTLLSQRLLISILAASSDCLMPRASRRSLICPISLAYLGSWIALTFIRNSLKLAG